MEEYSGRNSKSSLFAAVTRGDRKTVEKLLCEDRSLLSSTDRAGRTPLHQAAVLGFGGIIELLLSYGAAIDARDLNACTPLHCALFEGRMNSADILIGNGADTCCHDSLIGITPLHIATAQGYLQMASLLVSQHAPVDEMESQGLTPLHISALKGDLSMTGFLLNHGATVNARSSEDRTPLDCAMAGHSDDVINLLSKHGAHSGGTVLKWEEFAASREVPECTEAYNDLLKSVRNGDRTVDFTLLRYLYALSSLFDPYGFSGRAHEVPGQRQWGQVADLMDRKEWKEAAELCDTLLEKEYIDMDLHLLSAIVQKELGRIEQELHHRYVYGRLFSSVRRSGDGRSPESAFVVVRLREEYMILGTLKGFLPVSQSLVTSGSHQYDRFELRHQETGETEQVYFNIDILRHRNLFHSVT
ncbi:MAG: ankyrin repeat domain-containing protein [Vulcanimicrobiota bacterium]